MKLGAVVRRTISDPPRENSVWIGLGSGISCGLIIASAALSTQYEIRQKYVDNSIFLASELRNCMCITDKPTVTDEGADVVFGGKLTFADGSRTLLLAEILDILDILQFYIYEGVVVER
ncbi:hypothetical protein BPOR_0144g00100 [Botrytis porri]|uniref:Uncharacterized protein n=1 Tax=Botrytis porri TaxID=87229 RepID=A0A4Z1KW45_9HELO|nr:hypothetical protein BPOR_0144g00100 [Botrytis porri]